MKLPKTGRIVVIDDKKEEGIPLVKALIKNGHLTTYFSDQAEDLPDNPLSGIRIVFLDIILGTESQGEKTKIATATHVLQKILAPDNGPFILVAWTKHGDLVSQITDSLRKEGYQFLAFDIKKDDCKNNSSGYDVQKIREKLKEKIEGNESLQLFIMWENIVHSAAGRVISDFAQFNPLDDEWNGKMTTIFWKLAMGYAGKQLDKTDPTEIIKNALYSFNGAFLDSINSEIRDSEDAMEIDLPFDDAKRNDDELAGEINSKLIFTMPKNKSILPGNIYEKLECENLDVEDIFDPTSGKFENVKPELDRAKHIFLETTPICDYAQKKLRLNRLVSGVMWPAKCYGNLKIHTKYLYISPIIKLQNELCHMVLDFRYFTSVSLNDLNEHMPILRVKSELLTEIQSQLAYHVNRPGIVSVR